MKGGKVSKNFFRGGEEEKTFSFSSYGTCACSMDNLNFYFLFSWRRGKAQRRISFWKKGRAKGDLCQIDNQKGSKGSFLIYSLFVDTVRKKKVKSRVLTGAIRNLV